MENQKVNDKRKILLFIPVMIFPFLALAFYAMGGGRGVGNQMPGKVGINAALPNASFGKEKPVNKMGIYQKGQDDSLKSPTSQLEDIASKLGFVNQTSSDPTRDIDLKIKQLNEQINSPIQDKVIPSAPPTVAHELSPDVDRLEKLMSTMQGDSSDDQQMKQLTGMLEKVLDIQHPERVRNAYLKQVSEAPEKSFAAIPAEVSDKQRIVQGAVLRLVLTDTVTLNNIKIPKGQEIFGLCNLTNQRLLVDVKTIRMGNSIIPVDLSIYSMDGIKGIAAPDAIVDNAISGGADDAVRSLQLLSMDQSVGVQVAGAGIDAAKGLFSKKVRRLKMKLKAGFPVLLRNNQIRN